MAEMPGPDHRDYERSGQGEANVVCVRRQLAKSALRPRIFIIFSDEGSPAWTSEAFE